MLDQYQDKSLGTGSFTDLYELTMMQAYLRERMHDVAVFELYIRNMPPQRKYFVAAGVNDVLAHLENIIFTHEEILWLKSLGRFDDTFLDYLRKFKFTGDVYAVPEGTVVFQDEPLIQVIAPLPEAQLVETYLLNQVHFQTMIATKAARITHAAGDRAFIDFASRRAHGLDAAVKTAKAAYIAGASGTSNVLAGKRYDIPVYGTMAHSYIQAHHEESDAFRQFMSRYPDATLLVDTYDTLDGVGKVIHMIDQYGLAFKPRGIRLDSADLGKLAKQSRAMLDQAGLNDVSIFVSSGIDEYRIKSLLDDDSPVDGFGVGTKLTVSEDCPMLDMAYKLVQYGGRGVTKYSEGKDIHPFRKQVYRDSHNGLMTADTVTRAEAAGGIPGRPLLHQVMQSGRRIDIRQHDLKTIRGKIRSDLGKLNPDLLTIEQNHIRYTVNLDHSLKREHATT